MQGEMWEGGGGLLGEGKRVAKFSNSAKTVQLSAVQMWKHAEFNFCFRQQCVAAVSLKCVK
jgi:hypothetical protein